MNWNYIIFYSNQLVYLSCEAQKSSLVKKIYRILVLG